MSGRLQVFDQAKLGEGDLPCLAAAYAVCDMVWDGATMPYIDATLTMIPRPSRPPRSLVQWEKQITLAGKMPSRLLFIRGRKRQIVGFSSREPSPFCFRLSNLLLLQHNGNLLPLTPPYPVQIDIDNF
jgi:hypothetical protein